MPLFEMASFNPSKMWLHFAFLTYVGLSSLLRVEYNSAVPNAYADETCHIKQVQYYCNGRFDKWSEVITTLPGLYFFSIGALKPISWIFGLTDDCSIVPLRALSLACGFGIFLLLHGIISHKNPDISEAKKAFHTLTLAFFPMLYFYVFKYYTESLSMLLILLMHYNHLKGKPHLSAIYGALAVFTRQTNIVWVFWHAMMEAWESSKDDIRNLLSKHTIFTNFMETEQNVLELEDEQELFQTLSRMGRSILRNCGSYLLIGVSFVIFVIVNGGIVVGDRANHKACLNIAQFFYFAAYTGFFLLPVISTRLKPTFDLLRRNPRVVLLGLTFGLFVVHTRTMMHWYLLTDYTHYIHYVGNALYRWYPSLKYGLVPVYLFVWTWILTNIQAEGVMKGFLTLVIALSVVPQLLMEFRYFVPGFIFIRLHLRTWEWRDLLGELLLYAIVNYVTFSKYMYGRWDDTIGEHRMMW